MSDDYYIVMEGVKCDRKMIELAEGAPEFVADRILDPITSFADISHMN